MKAVVTGSGGLTGSECVRLLCEEGWQVVGVDNDMRQSFFGPGGTTRPVVKEISHALPNYHHLDLDIRDRQAIRDLFQRERPTFVIHTAAQQSHDKAASILYEDFDVNAVGTMNMLVAARDFDVEGEEEKVLRGSLKTLSKFRPIVLCDDNDDKTLSLLSGILLPLDYEVLPGPPVIGIPR